MNDDLPLRERVGRYPMTEDELRAAVDDAVADAATRGEDPAIYRLSIEARFWRLNRDVRERQRDERDAARAHATVEALRQARAEKKAQAAADRATANLTAAREFLGGTGPAVRRPAGRRGWTQATFHAAYGEARDRAGGPAALDKEIAAAWPISLKRFQELVRRFGRPA